MAKYRCNQCLIFILVNFSENLAAIRIFRLAGNGSFTKNCVIDMCGGKRASIYFSRLVNMGLITTIKKKVVRAKNYEQVFNNNFLSVLNEIRYCTTIVVEKCNESFLDAGEPFNSNPHKWLVLYKNSNSRSSK